VACSLPGQKLHGELGVGADDGVTSGAVAIASLLAAVLTGIYVGKVDYSCQKY
jgi:hypothetical protein